MNRQYHPFCKWNSLVPGGLVGDAYAAATVESMMAF